MLLTLASLSLFAGTGQASAAPAVTAKTPAAGATEVPVSSTISATFSEPMEPATMTSGSVTLSKPLRIKAIAAGYNYTLALRDNGTVIIWGYDGNGQTDVPTGLGDVTAIAAGSNQSVVLKNDGTVAAWGENTWGEATVPAGLSGVTAIAAGGLFTLALKTDETIVAWGDNSYGQKTIPGGLSGVTRIAAGYGHVLAMKSDGTVVAWGNNGSGQVTVPPELSGVIAIAAGLNHSVALKADGTIVAWGDNGKGQTSVPAGLSGVIAISAQLDNTLALKDDGTVIAWGDNGHGQTDVPANLSGITAIAAGYYHSVALKNDGTVFSWGDNSCSQTTLPAGLSGVTGVAAGSSHTVALKNDGTLFAWGNNDAGQAVIPAGLSGVNAIAAGVAHTLSLGSSGVVNAWGRNDTGQTTVPTDLAGVTAIAAGDYHSVALKNDGTVVAWGLNSSGQTTVPAGLAGVTKIAAGSAHTVALNQDGTVTAWGSNVYDINSTPVGLSGVIAIAAGGYHTVALKSDGTVTAWGEDWQGQSMVPTGLTDVIAVAAGKSHSVALKSDGTVTAWGSNDFGESSVPAGLDRVVGIAAGTGYTVVVRNDGTVVAWGDNLYGQTAVPQDPYWQAIATEVSYSTGSDTFTLTPAASLPPATTLTATVNTGVRSLEGIHPPADDSWSFTTAATLATTASPPGGTYSSMQNVTLTANAPAAIYYTTNGSDPTVSSPVYSGPIPVSVTTSLKFFARDTAGNDETPQTATYTMVADTTPPVTSVSPAGGTYSSAQNVTLAANEPATIYYTTNGSDPTVSSPVYSGPIRLLVSTILKFFGRDTAGNRETVKTATYTINLDTTPPVTTASPAGGTYSSARSVTLTANEPATIYYTTNGSDPTISSPVYSGPIQVPATTTLKFFARDTAGNGETVKTAAYTIDTTPPVTTASPAGGTYSSAQNVTLTANEPATIYYTTNGNDPTISSPVYTGPIQIPVSTILKFFGQDTAGNNETVKSVTYNIKQNQTISFAPLPAKTYGDSSFILGATAGSGLPVSYTSSNTSVATVSGTTITIVGAGTATITASQSGDATYNPAVAVTRTLAVNTAALIVRAVDATRAYGAVNPVFSATYSGFVNGDTLAVVTGSPALSTAATATSPTGAYPVTVTIGDLAAANYSFSLVNGALSVTKADQTITFGAPPAKTYGDAHFTLDATAGSGLAVSYTSSNTSVATVSGTTVTIVGTGTTTITASQSGDATCNPAPAVAQTLTVNKAVLTIQAVNSTREYGAANPVFSVTYSGFINGDTQEVLSGSSGLATTAVSASPAGTYPITVTAGTLATANYSFSFFNATLSITRAEQTITFGALPAKTYGDPSFTLGAAAGSGLAVSYTSSNPAVATVSGTTVTIIGAGTTTITASQSGDGNYNPAPAVAQTLTVNKAVLTVRAVDATRVYGAANPVFSVTYSGFINGDTQAVLSGTSDLSTAAISTSAAGTYPITITAGTVAAANYSFSFVNGTLTVIKAGQTITFGALPAKTYGDSPFTLSAMAGSGLAVSYTSSNPAVATVSGSTVTIIGAGTATITADQSGDASYNPAPAATRTLAVNQATITVQAVNFDRKYGTANPAFSATYNGFINGDTQTVLSGSPTLSTTATPTSPVGTYPVTVTAGTLSAANYSFSFVNGTLSITKADQSITFGAPPAKTYGDAPFTVSATADSGLAVSYTSSNASVATVSGQVVTIIGAGTATITAIQSGDSSYNPALAVARTLTVNKAPLTIQAVDVTRMYGTANPAFSTTYSGFINGDTQTVLSGSPTLSTAATPTSSVGTYPVTVSAGTLAAANYSFNFADGTLTVIKAGQTISFGALPAKTYGDADFTLGATAGSGLAVSFTSSNSSVATVSGTTLTIVGAGNTTITADQSGDSNYNTAPAVAQSLTINKAAATVTLGNLNTTYDGTPKAATATTSPAGLSVIFTYNSLTTAPTAVASYTIVGTVSDPNYQGSATGTLTIAKGNQTITFDALPVKTYGDPAFTLAATASSGLAMTYTSSNTSVATVSGSSVTIVGAGSATITATQVGNTNYNAAPAVAQTLTINKAVATITFGLLSFVYDSTLKPVTVTAIPAGLAVAITYDGSATAPIDVGRYTVVATVNDANYQGSATATEEITKKSQTITFGPLPVKTYGDASFTFSADASSNLQLTFQYDPTIVGNITKSGQKYLMTIAGAGTTVITATQSGNRNYSDAPPVSQTFTVNKAGGTVTLGSLSTIYDGTAKAATATTNPLGIAVTFSYNGSATAPTAAGSYSVVGTISNPNYQGSSSGTLTIAKTNQTITFGTLPVKSYGNAPFNPNATASSSLAISYSSSNPAVATISGTTVTIIGVGTTTITASQGGDSNYNTAAAVPQTLTVSKGTATVTLGDLNTEYNGTLRAATATTLPAGLPVTLTYNGSATAPAAVGTYTVIATVTDANYDGNTTGTLTIAKGAQTIAFGALPLKTFGDAPFTLNATATSSLAVSYSSSNPAVATITGTTITIVGAGTTTITATQGGDGNYDAAAAVPQTLTVSKGTATITLGSLNATYNGTPRSATATTLPAGLPVTLTYNGLTSAPAAVGTYTVVANVTDANYDGNTSGTLTIAKGAQTITFGTLPLKTVGDAPFSLNAAATSTLAVSYSSSNPAVATISGTTVTIVGVGTTIITASQSGDGNYNAATAVPQTLTVGKGTATITLGNLNTMYNGTQWAVTATTSPAGLPITFTYNGSATAPIAVGSYTVVATVNDSNYQGNSTDTLTIAKGAQTIAFGTPPPKTFNDAPFTLNATSTSGLAISYGSSNPAVATISGTTVTIVGAGTTTIIASQDGDGSYNAAAAVPQTLTVNKGTAAVTLGGLNTEYNGTPRPATATTTPTGLPVTLTYNGLATAPVAVGTYTVVATVTDANYEGNATGTLTVAKGAQTITFGSLSAKTYGDPAFSLTAAASSTLAVTYTSSNPAVATISSTTVTIVGVGTASITAAQGGDGSYNAATAVSQTLTVSKGTATVTLGGLNTTYNGTQRAASATTIPNGLPVTITYNDSATMPTAAGTYSVTATITSPNYQGSTTSTLTIAKGSQTITFGSLPTKTVGNAQFTLNASATSGLAISYTSSNPAVATINGMTVTIVSAGTATITASQGGNANYDAAAPVTQTLTVNAAQPATGKTAVTIGATTSYFDTVTAALATIPAGSTTTFKLQAMTFTEAVNINISNATVIIITGGYDSGFASAAGMTTIQGSLVISAGTLVADRLVIM